MDLDDDLEAKKSSNRGTVIAFAVVGAAAIGGGLFMRHHMKVTARDLAVHTAATSWNSLQRCLIGPPLAAGENVTLRLHKVEVDRDPLPQGGSASDTNERWPYRCAVHATTLRDALAGIEPMDATQQRLHDAAEHVRLNLTHGQLETTNIRTHEPTVFDALWDAASHVQLPTPGAYTGPAAPVVSTMLTRDDFHPLFAHTGAGEVQILASDRTPAASLHVAIAQGDAYGCQFASAPDAEHNLATAHCAPLGTTVAGGQTDAVMFDAVDAYTSYPPVRIGTGRDAKVSGLGTATVAEARPWAFRGAVSANGTISLIDSNNAEADDAAATGHWRLTQTHAGAAGFRGALTLPPESSRPDILPDRVLYLASSEPGHGPPRVGLFSRALSDGVAPLGATTDAGTVVEDSRIAGHCRTTHALGVAIGAPHALIMMMSYGNAWRPPQTFDGHFDTLNCTETDVVATWTDARPPTIHQVRCNASGCTASQERVPSLSSVWGRTGGTPEVADLDGNILMVWSPEEGGLRMRLAPVGHINDARDVVLYDDHGHQGGWVQAPNIFVRGTTAVVVFTDAERDTDKHAFAVRIQQNGAFSAVAPAS